MLKLRGLKQARLAKGLSLRQLHRLSGVAASTISYVENGRRWAYRETAEALARALDVPVSQLVNPDIRVMSAEEQARILRQLDDILSELEVLPDSILRHIRNAIDGELARRLPPVTVQASPRQREELRRLEEREEAEKEGAGAAKLKPPTPPTIGGVGASIPAQ